MRVASSTLLYLGGFAGGMADSSFTYNHHHPPQHPELQYIERYSARLDGHQFGATRLLVDAKDICNVRTGRLLHTAVGSWTKRWWH